MTRLSTRELFQPVARESLGETVIVRPSMTYWQDAWRRLKKSRMAMVGLAIIILMILFAILVPMFSPYSYAQQDVYNRNKPPSLEHWFGTDNLGRDVFVRTAHGARISLFIGFFSVFMNLTLGVIYGGISGLFGGRVDDVMMRIVDILYGVPLLLVVILLMVVMGSGLKTILIAFGIAYWIVLARIVRGQILAVKEQEFVLAARLLGASRWRILFRHLLPNAMGPIIIMTTMQIPAAIFLEAFLSFIGLGVSAPIASWGTLASDGYKALRSYPWLLFFPAMAISVTVLAFNFLGDGLRDALDPHLRRG